MIELPNKLWLRSTKLPKYSICLDPADRFFGWMMVEHPDGKNWTSTAKLTAEEVAALLRMPAAVLHLPQLKQLQEQQTTEGTK